MQRQPKECGQQAHWLRLVGVPPLHHYMFLYLGILKEGLYVKVATADENYTECFLFIYRVYFWSLPPPQIESSQGGLQVKP